MSDLKPRGVKAPLNLLPLGPLKAIAAAMEHGALKYAPWNWQDVEQPQAEIDELYAALLRHTFAASDPSQPDTDEESGLHHICHAGACVILLLYKLGIDYQPSRLLGSMQQKMEILHTGPDPDRMRTLAIQVQAWLSAHKDEVRQEQLYDTMVATARPMVTYSHLARLVMEYHDGELTKAPDLLSKIQAVLAAGEGTGPWPTETML